MGANVSTMRPARDLLHQLPMLPIRPDLSVDYEAADAALLLALAENGETVMNTLQQGLSEPPRDSWRPVGLSQATTMAV